MTTFAHSVPRSPQQTEAGPPTVGSAGAPNAESPQRNNSTSLRRALRVLDAVSDYRVQPSGISLASLAASVEMSKSTVLRLIAPLRDEGLIHQDRDSGRYRLGPTAVRLGTAFVERVDLGVLAADLLRDLARRAGAAVALVIPGHREPARRTAGTVVLQALGADGDRLAADQAVWAAACIRDPGWWVEIDDVGTGWGTVAAPVVDHRSLMTAVESSLPSQSRVHPAGVEARRGRTPTVGDLVRECASALSERLGAPRRESDPLTTPTTPTRTI